MAKILAYTSPARGHLYPLVPTLDELRRRGHEVALRTMAHEAERLSAKGWSAQPVDPAVEAREIDDWKARTQPGALLAASRTFLDRGRHEIDDLRRAIGLERPRLLLVDVNSWGASAAAEASGLPWASFAPYFLPVRGPGVPPWGLGLSPRRDRLGRWRDAVLWRIVEALFDRALPALNDLRAAAGVPSFRHVPELATRAKRVLMLTAEPFEYPRSWPPNVRLVGPGLWEPEGEAPAHHAGDGRPLVLATCSTEYQDDGALVQAALTALADEPVRVVATTGPVDPATLPRPANARVERFLPHGPILRTAACVVCHGGMGTTQKALAAGVPVCVVPFGRDQVEVARHVVVAGAGTRVSPRRLTPARLRRAVREAIALRPGAERIAEAFRRAGGAPAAADALEELLADGAPLHRPDLTSRPVPSRAPPSIEAAPNSSETRSTWNTSPPDSTISWSAPTGSPSASSKRRDTMTTSSRSLPVGEGAFCHRLSYSRRVKPCSPTIQPDGPAPLWRTGPARRRADDTATTATGCGNVIWPARLGAPGRARSITARAPPAAACGGRRRRGRRGAPARPRSRCSDPGRGSTPFAHSRRQTRPIGPEKLGVPRKRQSSMGYQNSVNYH